MSLLPTIKPKALQRGDSIAIISPSARLNNVFPNRISRAKAFFESEGYTIKIIYTEKLSNDHITKLHQRCSEIHEAFSDPSIKAIVCAIGGITANEILPFLDYNLIKQNPKIFCGYSDITLLHHAIYTKTGLRTFYGPAAITQWGEYPSPHSFTKSHFFSILSSSDPNEYPSPIPRSPLFTQEFLDWESPSSDTKARTLGPAPSWTWLRRGGGGGDNTTTREGTSSSSSSSSDTAITGRLLGGCLPSLVQLTGTPYLPASLYGESILFLETPEGDTGPGDPYIPEMARCALTDLRNSGILSQIRGLVLGRPYMYTPEMRKAFEEMVLEQCYGFEWPILANVDVGHTDPILTLPLGGLVRLDPGRDLFEVLGPAVV